MIAVIGCKNGHRRLCLFRLPNAAYRVVNHRYHTTGECLRLPGFAIARPDRSHALEFCATFFAIAYDACDVRRRRPVIDHECFRDLHFIGIVHVPIPTRRVEWMMWIGEGNH